MSLILGIEIGGSKLQLAIGSGDDPAPLVVERLNINPADAAEGIRRQILAAVPHLLRTARLQPREVSGVGVGFGGPVKADLATVTKSHQVSGWDDFPLAQWMEAEFGWRAVVHNDADAAALAEARFGTGRACNPVFYVTIGSGIGGGLIIDGKIYRGAGAGACEIGHLKVPDLAVPGNPWRTSREWWVPVEHVCSGWSITRRAMEALVSDMDLVLRGLKDKPSRLRELGNPSPEAVARAAREGDELAQQLLDETWTVLGWAIAQMITLLHPQRVVIGGGVSRMGEDLLFEPLRREVGRFVFPPFADLYEIVPAALGEQVVVYGALTLARDAFVS